MPNSAAFSQIVQRSANRVRAQQRYEGVVCREPAKKAAARVRMNVDPRHAPSEIERCLTSLC